MGVVHDPLPPPATGLGLFPLCLLGDLAWLSPWHHFIATDPMGNGVDWPSAAWLAILAAIPLGASVHLFKRRDIAA